MGDHDLLVLPTFAAAVLQSQVILDTPVAITLVVGAFSALGATIVKLFTNLSASHAAQLADKNARIATLELQLERSNRLADEATLALRESIREGHRTLNLVEQR